MLAPVPERTMWRRRQWQRLPGWLRQIAELGALPSDSEEVRVRKAVVMLCAIIPATLAFVWVGTYAALGLWLYASADDAATASKGGASSSAVTARPSGNDPTGSGDAGG
jgi:hypothetical protein